MTHKGFKERLAEEAGAIGRAERLLLYVFAIALWLSLVVALGAGYFSQP